MNYSATCYVYFARAKDGAIKIGKSYDVAKRVAQLRRNGRKLVLLVKAEGSDGHEREIHGMFAKERMDGEWFRPSARLYSFIEKVRERGALPKAIRLAHMSERELSALGLRKRVVYERVRA